MRTISFFICLSSVFFSHSLRSTSGLNILLTNDDGYTSEGIKAASFALVEAGHRVTIVAPKTQQSATGMKITLGSLSAEQHAAEVWSVSGSPADAVMIGLNNVFGKEVPDLVISGANFGQNLGSNVMLSGTVGAASMAVFMGVPAIALSVGLDLGESTGSPEPYVSTIAAFPEAAEFLVAVVEQYTNNPAVIPKGELLNINYPVRAPARPAILASRVSNIGGFVVNHEFRTEGSSTINTIVSLANGSDGLENSDVAAFSKGNITISFLKPDWNGSQKNFARLVELATAIQKSRKPEAR
jgi:5'-nucleotidase